MTDCATGHVNLSVTMYISGVTATKHIVDGWNFIAFVLLNLNLCVAIHCRLITAAKHSTCSFCNVTIFIENITFYRRITRNSKICFSYLSESSQIYIGIEVVLSFYSNRTNCTIRRHFVNMFPFIDCCS